MTGVDTHIRLALLVALKGREGGGIVERHVKKGE